MVLRQFSGSPDRPRNGAPERGAASVPDRCDVGGLTPPFGYVLFALKSAAPDVPTTEIFRASWPFVWIIVAGMVILAVFPDLITFLPNLTRPR